MTSRIRVPLRLAITTAAVLGMGSLLCVDGATASAAQPSRSAAAVHWYHTVVSELQPLQSTLPAGLQAATAWQQGSETAAEAALEFNRDLPRLVQVHNRLTRLPPLAGHRATRDDYVVAIGLYVDAFRLARATTRLPAGPVVAQLQRAFLRVRQLGDVTFDEGTAQLASLLGPSIAGPDVQAASRIPDWSSLGLAPGEPLVSAWPAVQPASGPRSRAGWAAAVAHDGAPSQSSVRAVLARSPTHPAQLSALAVALGQAAASLNGVPGPVGAPATPALARLGLLVDGEAMMAGEAGDLAGSDGTKAFTPIAVALSSMGSSLRSASGSSG